MMYSKHVCIMNHYIITSFAHYLPGGKWKNLIQAVLITIN
jgi:hypothetical protein